MTMILSDRILDIFKSCVRILFISKYLIIYKYLIKIDQILNYLKKV